MDVFAIMNAKQIDRKAEKKTIIHTLSMSATHIIHTHTHCSVQIS